MRAPSREAAVDSLEQLPVVLAGAPFDDGSGFFGPATDVGSVAVLLAPANPGSALAGGMSPGASGDAGDHVPGQQFGRALTGLGSWEWAVGWPGRHTPASTNSGLVSVFSWQVDDDGSAELVIGWRESFDFPGGNQAGMMAIGTDGSGWETVTQSTPGVPGTDQDFDRFGTQAMP